MNTNTESPKFPACKCGCGLGVRFSDATYLPGHDARHKGQIAREIIATGNKGLINQLPSQALQDQAKELVIKWVNKGKVPGGPKLAKKSEAPAQPEAKLEVKIGRWTYPVKKHAESYLRNNKRDGSGTWGTMTEAEIAKIKEV